MKPEAQLVITLNFKSKEAAQRFGDGLFGTVQELVVNGPEDDRPTWFDYQATHVNA